MGAALEPDRGHLPEASLLFAVQRTIALFGDPGAVTLTPLPYALTGNLSDIHHLMFRKTDGKYLLAIWNDAETWNRTNAGKTAIPLRSIKLALGSPASLIRRHLPTTTATIATVETNVQELTMSVPDEVAVYEITLS